jgi:hypothetical protein
MQGRLQAEDTMNDTEKTIHDIAATSSDLANQVAKSFSAEFRFERQRHMVSGPANIQQLRYDPHVVRACPDHRPHSECAKCMTMTGAEWINGRLDSEDDS